jgi:DNA-binding CsgD family transcriptional regulator
VADNRIVTAADLAGTLSRRERQILEMVALGLTNLEVSKQLGVTVHAVKFHLASIYRKLGVGNRTEAAVALLRSDGAGTSA